MSRESAKLQCSVGSHCAVGGQREKRGVSVSLSRRLQAEKERGEWWLAVCCRGWGPSHDVQQREVSGWPGLSEREERSVQLDMAGMTISLHPSFF